jgi:hypothetical protein
MVSGVGGWIHRSEQVLERRDAAGGAEMFGQGLPENGAPTVAVQTTGPSVELVEGRGRVEDVD